MFEERPNPEMGAKNAPAKNASAKTAPVNTGQAQPAPAAAGAYSQAEAVSTGSSAHARAAAPPAERSHTWAGALVESRYLLWLILAAGAVLRLVTLDVQSFWLDEAISFWTVNHTPAGLVDQLSNGFRPFFFVILYPAYLLGHEEWLLRLPSALIGIASIGLIYILGWEFFDRTTGLLAAAFLALSPVHLWYSQETRFYALIGLLALGAAYFALRGLKYNRSLDWVMFGVCEGLGLWTESGSVWIILGLNLAAVLLLRRLWVQRRIFGWALAQVVGVVIYLPRLSTFVSSVQGGSTSWIPVATIRRLLVVLSDFSGGFMHSALFGMLSLLFVGLGLLLGLRWMLAEMPRRWTAYAFLLPWLAAPITASFILSQPYYRPEFLHFLFGDRPSIFLTRNLIAILFPLLLLLARGLVLLYRRPSSLWRWAGLGLATGLLVLYAGGYYINHVIERKEDYRSAVALITAETGQDDLVLASPGYIEQPVAYYIYRDQPPIDVPLESLRDGIVASQDTRQDPGELYQFESDLERVILEHDRVWLVTNFNVNQPFDPELVAFLEQHATLERTEQFEGTLVRLYDLPGRGASTP